MTRKPNINSTANRLDVADLQRDPALPMTAIGALLPSRSFAERPGWPQHQTRAKAAADSLDCPKADA